jgi:hypothetical protein
VHRYRRVLMIDRQTRSRELEFEADLSLGDTD